jgi:hypothetical protein
MLFLSFFVVQSLAFMNLDLVGEWRSETQCAHFKDGDKFVSGTIGSYFITEQQGHAFKGYKLIDTIYETNMKESFSGVISYDGKKLYFAEHKDGYAIADVVTADLVYFYYLESEETKAIFLKLERVK